MRPVSAAKVPVMHRDVTVFFLCTLASGAASSIALEDPDDAPERATCSAVRLVLCMFSCVMRHYGFRASRVTGSRILTKYYSSFSVRYK